MYTNFVITACTVFSCGLIDIEFCPHTYRRLSVHSCLDMGLVGPPTLLYTPLPHVYRGLDHHVGWTNVPLMPAHSFRSHHIIWSSPLFSCVFSWSPISPPSHYFPHCLWSPLFLHSFSFSCWLFLICLFLSGFTFPFFSSFQSTNFIFYVLH